MHSFSSQSARTLFAQFLLFLAFTVAWGSLAPAAERTPASGPQPTPQECAVFQKRHPSISDFTCLGKKKVDLKRVLSAIRERGFTFTSNSAPTLSLLEVCFLWDYACVAAHDETGKLQAFAIAKLRASGIPDRLFLAMMDTAPGEAFSESEQALRYLLGYLQLERGLKPLRTEEFPLFIHGWAKGDKARARQIFKSAGVE
jgi:hypothetical protein